MKFFARIGVMGFAAVMAVSLAGCGGVKSSSPQMAEQSKIPQFNDLKVGEDYTDIKADLKFITHKTDVVDTVFRDYVARFREMYPNVTITYEGVTNYADDMITRLTTGNWGDICMIPTQVDKNELENYFFCLGDKTELEKSYVMLNNYSYKNNVYGMPSMGNVQGILYNKKVFENAGITDLPKTPDEFLDALQKIKEHTDAIPLYTNFAAGWAMSAWNAYITGSATGNPDYANNVLVHSKDPFAKRDDMTGPYAVYYTLYESVKRGLTEDDPTTTDWEGSKGMMNNGQIGAMVLGSWAVTQMQAAGDHPDDIGYMAFPITVDGKQYATAAPDYNYGVNINSSADNQIASMLYIKWLTEDSGFAYDQGGIPICKGKEYPAVYKMFDGVELVIDNPAPDGEESLYNDINNESEVGLNVSPDGVSKILEAAVAGSPALDEIMADWNERWTAAQEKYGAIQ